jgi:ABC-type dipeptide/oligopeptide/nickel transport system ATPase component
LLGESGIGKSLISKAIFGLLSSDDLEITLNNSPYTDYTKSLTCAEIQEKGFFVFQEPSSHLNPLRTLDQQLNEGSIHDPSSNRQILARLFPVNLNVSNYYPFFQNPTGPAAAKNNVSLLPWLLKRSPCCLDSLQMNLPCLSSMNQQEIWTMRIAIYSLKCYSVLRRNLNSLLYS